MGPFSEEKQYQRAEAIQRLLDTNPQLNSETKTMWERKLKELSFNESTYNFRVREVYTQMRNSYTRRWL
jgi:hypothetical protein